MEQLHWLMLFLVVVMFLCGRKRELFLDHAADEQENRCYVGPAYLPFGRVDDYKENMP